MLASRALLFKNAAASLKRQPACLFHQSSDWGNWGNTNVAVVFSGSGWWDGTDTHEAAYTLFHLSRNGAKFQMYAPNQQQMHVIDHTRNQPMSGENRNVMIESSRLARGKIQDLSRLDVNQFDAVIFPGGFGITKNLSTYNSDGKDCKVNNDIEKILKEFHHARKPIGLSCTSPILACRVLPGIEVTMGHERDESNRWGRWPYYNMTQAVKNMGAKHIVKEPYEAHVDEKNRVITTPTFMWETDYHYHYIFDGIGNMVKHVLRMSGK
ncbi:ES1 protein, mitochondrial [Latimeria chalumnae]|uniref:Glutamine amidotransferase class 1 domain containing 3, like n=1 Tax=Latimeria chalumnae TaxID=7897 RepID=H3B2V9_LATCH|nr:PREDICTED: ES1 protein, mitochondrial-like [Latimeria chalumnae]|eukprot:XP_005995297.1 PREDICTED: ES1 protein, mitochondrial-like [Latimeria chalumnae]